MMRNHMHPVEIAFQSEEEIWQIVGVSSIWFQNASGSIKLLSDSTLVHSLLASTLGLFLGTIYSVPPFRMKRFPVATFLIIATVRGFLLNFGVYHATRAALGLPFQWSAHVAFITYFVTLFALVIAITKDLPDVEGDRKASYGIEILLRGCIELYDTAGDSTDEAMTNVKSGDYDSVKVNLNAALDARSDCQDGFMERKQHI
ncbi:unnamed protein product [Microthlaspi erraticum]|uniref:Pectinesterase inhibitor domain-containing protein n=1 Tax=Microthlaspi erraticum TaxID=1685480 RepID=A0A6D2KIT7_9BRAS|nr:unnamed protein product [Microthlaspi erraticum]